MLNDGLKNREHDNIALQAQRDVYKDQLQKYQDIIIAMIIEKNTAPNEGEFYEYPYYIARIRRRFITKKKQQRCFKAKYPHHRFIIEEIGNRIVPMHSVDLKRRVM